jgi:hypothetical protein
MSAVKDQDFVTMEAGKGVEVPGRIVTRLKGDALVVGEFVRVDERWEEETKKCALAIVRGVGVLDWRVVMMDV